jgi:amino acid transporter
LERYGRLHIKTKRQKYKQELHQCIGPFQIFSFGFNFMSVLITITGLFDYGLKDGGPVLMTWGWIIVSIMTIIVSISLGELSSAYPNAGSVYVWSGQLTQLEWAPWTSYWTAIANFTGYLGSLTSTSFVFAAFVNAAWVVHGQDNIKDYVKVFYSEIAIGLWALINLLRIETIAAITSFGVYFQMALTLVVVFVLMTMAPELQTTEYIFTEWNNDTGINSLIYVIFLAAVFPLYSLAGYDCAGQLAEETHEPHKAAPWGIFRSVIVSVVLGFIFICAVLYSMPSITKALSGTSGESVYEILVLNTDIQCATTIAWAMVVCVFFTGISRLTVVTRLMYAFFRDQGIMFHDYLSYVDPKKQIPTHCVWVIFVICFLVNLMSLTYWSHAVFISLITLTISGFQISYAIPIAIKALYPTPGGFPLAPFRLGRRISKVFAFISFIWLLFTGIVVYLPAEYPITSENFNYAIMLAAFIIIIAYLNWWYSVRYFFRGPLRFCGDDAERENDAAEEDTEEFKTLDSELVQMMAMSMTERDLLLSHLVEDEEDDAVYSGIYN